LTNFVYVNGEFVPKDEARVSVFDHGYLYGDGVFEGIRAYNRRIFRLHDHIDRLFRSMKLISLNLGVSKEHLGELIGETLRKNQLTDAYIRVVVSRGTGSRLGLSPRLCPKPTVVIITEESQSSFSQAGETIGLSLIISSVRRDPVDATTHEIKSQNYLNCILALIEANALGMDDAIMLDSRGFVSEATTSNVFIVVDGRMYTPSSASAILHGVTRQVTIELAGKLGVSCTARDITPYELLTADEAFLVGTKIEVAPIANIRGIKIGRHDDGNAGPVTKAIMAEFRKISADPSQSVAY
jgi:branched-chain amino acid aminotransferase